MPLDAGAQNNNPDAERTSMLAKRIRLVSAGAMLAASLAMALPVAHAAPVVKKVRLIELYSRYAKNDNMVSGLPEFGDDKRIRFSAVVVEHSQALVGGNILSAGDPSQPDEELARLSGFDDAQARRLDALPVGAKFNAICSIGYTLHTDYLSLTDCVVK